MFPFIQSLIFSFSNELNSQNFYNELNGLTGFSAYFQNCESLSSFPNGTNVKKICARLLKYLESNTIPRNTDKYDVCILLNFWVYKKLFDTFHSKDISYVYQAFGKLQPIWNGFVDDKIKKSEHKKCRPISDLVLYGDWKERKELHEYYVDYDDLINTLVGWPQRCEEIYKYVESKKTLYDHFKKGCPSENQYECPQYYSEYEKYHPDKVLYKLDCHKYMKKEDASPPASAGALPENTHQDMSSSQTFSLDSPQLKSDRTHPATKTGNILLGVVATSLTSGALYRFTPLGGMIRNGLGWNNNNMSNINGGDFRLYDYASEPFNPYPGEEHYIGYHPA
ncbi:PIR protein [Plasmodium vivax]|uniref:VIR protein n=1 Tax=Plasmodium vivax TaxID=5855 RepID=A0A565A5V7_PLAVI|nr:PIR protein [Plasmodium vivax]